MNEQGVAAYIGCFQSPVGIAASQAAASKYNTPFLIDVGASDLIVNRGLEERLPPEARLRRSASTTASPRWARSTRRPAASPRAR